MHRYATEHLALDDAALSALRARLLMSS
ncbi:hypothetical protein [Actinoplanes sp. NPDC049599]